MSFNMINESRIHDYTIITFLEHFALVDKSRWAWLGTVHVINNFVAKYKSVVYIWRKKLALHKIQFYVKSLPLLLMYFTPATNIWTVVSVILSICQ